MFVVYYVYLLLQGGRTALMLASEARVNMWDKVSSPTAVKYLLLICVLVVCVTRESDK